MATLQTKSIGCRLPAVVPDGALDVGTTLPYSVQSSLVERPAIPCQILTLPYKVVTATYMCLCIAPRTLVVENVYVCVDTVAEASQALSVRWTKNSTDGVVYSNDIDASNKGLGSVVDASTGGGFIRADGQRLTSLVGGPPSTTVPANNIIPAGAAIWVELGTEPGAPGGEGVIVLTLSSITN